MKTKIFNAVIAVSILSCGLTTSEAAHAVAMCAYDEMLCPVTHRCEKIITVNFCGQTTQIPSNCPSDPDMAEEVWTYSSSGPHANCTVHVERGGQWAGCVYTDANNPLLTPDVKGEAYCVTGGGQNGRPDVSKSHCGPSSAATQCLHDNGLL
jgi:hypothetical protein